MIYNESRRIILDLAVSLDGFIEGINGGTDWCIIDEDMDFVRFLSSVDTILYGRKSYELWGNISQGMKPLIWKEKRGNWFIVRRSMCFQKH